MDYMPLFQYFGGKRRVADVVWSAFGDVKSYSEPFFGSGAMLFCRPSEHQQERREVVNDADGYVANFWRSVQANPDAVACAADWPCSEIDLHARHATLVARMAEVREKMLGNPAYCEPELAGWWCWGLCWWIGTGWCAGTGPWKIVDGALVRRPHLSNDGLGIKRKRPHLGSDGMGINRKRPHLSNDGMGKCELYSEFIRALVGKFADRLRRVRVCCGDWARVVTPSAASYNPSDKKSTVGIFLDPPYSTEANRDMSCYATDCGKVAHEVRAWCVENGEDPRLRIALCGYESEHDELESLGWRVFAWKSNGMSSSAKSATQAKANTARERIWFSPHCLKPDVGSLFKEDGE